jgi:hypothetical protein
MTLNMAAPSEAPAGVCADPEVLETFGNRGLTSLELSFGTLATDNQPGNERRAAHGYRTRLKSDAGARENSEMTVNKKRIVREEETSWRL